MLRNGKNKSHVVANYALRFPRGDWSLMGPDKPDGVWDKTAEKMMIEFSETAHPIFRASSALERGELRIKGGGKKTVHSNGGEQNVELILCMVISANLLSIHGAVADFCTEVFLGTMASGKPEAHASQDPLETMEIPTETPTADPRTFE